MNRRIMRLVGAALVALPLVGAAGTALAQRTGSESGSGGATNGTGPAGSAGATGGSTSTTNNGSNAGVGNSSGTAASQGWPHAGHKAPAGNAKSGQSTTGAEKSSPTR